MLVGNEVDTESDTVANVKAFMLIFGAMMTATFFGTLTMIIT